MSESIRRPIPPVGGNPTHALPEEEDWMPGYRATLLRRLTTPRGFISAQTARVTRPTLDQIFVEPETEREIGVDQSAGIVQTLEDIDGNVLVVSESGLGKSTLLAKVAETQLRRGIDVIFVELGAFESFLKARAGEPARHALTKTDFLDLLLESMREHIPEVTKAQLTTLLEGKPLLCLDALNEIGDQSLRNVMTRTLDLVPAWFPTARYILTVTKAAVQTALAQLPAGMDVVEVSPWTYEKAQDYADKYVQAYFPRWSRSERQALWNPVVSRLRSSPDIFGSPLYMSAVVSVLVGRSTERLETGFESRFEVLRTLATWIVDHHVKDDNEASRDELFLTLARFCSVLVGHGGANELRNSAAPDEFSGDLKARIGLTQLASLRAMANQGGLVQMRWADVIVHERLRDYFAAVALARNEGLGGSAGWEDWLEAAVDHPGSVGVLEFLPDAILESRGLGSLSAFVEKLTQRLRKAPPSTATSWLAAVGRSLMVLRLRGVSPHRQATELAAYLNTLGREMNDPDKGHPVGMRASFSEACALIVGTQAESFTEAIIWSVAGEGVTLGSQAADVSEPGYDPWRAPWELNAYSYVPARFGLGKYAVTVLEYERFLEAGGYSDPSFWSEDDWKWRKANDVGSPRDWEVQRSRPTSPVTGVSFFEAEAYCRWLTEQVQADIVCRLPSEAEWEWSARRGALGRFPWGDTLSEQRPQANWAGAGLRRKTPVGLFSGVTDAESLQDMIGNVEEWCTDVWSSDSLEFQHVGLPGKRVVKGGSCIRYARLCRPAYRSRVLPEGRYHTLGFRCAFVPE